MDFQLLASNLSRINGTIFVKCPVMDFTEKKPVSLKVCAKDGEFDVTFDRETLPRVIDFLNTTIFKPKSTVICWNIKALYSYALFYTGRDLSFSDPQAYLLDGTPIPHEPILLDLQIVEHYNGINKRPPENYADAMRRLKYVYPLDFLDTYKTLHLPLMKEVIPRLETSGIIYDQDKVYAHYDIEGQDNGRLRCSTQFKKTYNPHTIKPDEKPNFRPPDLGAFFIYFDYQALEVRILQWLSGDRRLNTKITRLVRFFSHNLPFTTKIICY